MLFKVFCFIYGCYSFSDWVRSKVGQKTLLYTTDVYRNINKEQAALKLNRLKEKAARYESHKNFLSRCVAEKLVPKGLKLELEPTLGNHDQEFLDNWFPKLNEFSLILMEHIVSYCGKTIEKTNNDISATETALKNAIEQEEFTRIQSAIETNVEATKRQLKHRKFKTYNILKYKSKDTQKITATLKTHQTLPKQSYAKAVSAGLKRKSSFTNFTNQLSPTSQNNETRKSPSTENASNQGISLQKKIQLLNPTTSKKPWGKPPKKVVEQLKNEIEQLKNEIRILKQNKQYNSNSNQPNSSTSHPKNVQSVSIPGGQQQHSTNNEVMKVMNFIQQTMATLLDYSEKLKSQFDIDMTQTEMS